MKPTKKDGRDAQAEGSQKELQLPDLPAGAAQGKEAPASMMTPAGGTKKTAPRRRVRDDESWRELLTHPATLFSLAQKALAVLAVIYSVSGLYGRLDDVESAVGGTQHALTRTRETIDRNHEAADLKFRAIQNRIDCVAKNPARDRGKNTCF